MRLLPKQLRLQFFDEDEVEAEAILKKTFGEMAPVA